MKKRILALIFVLTLTIGIMPLSAYATDSPSKWATEIVNAAIGAGLVPQPLQSKYTQTMTRAEFCALAATLYETVTGMRITERISLPDDKLTREQAAVMLVRLADSVGSPLTGYKIYATVFSDEASISDWAADAVHQVQEAGIMVGVEVEGCTFAPQAPYTREQGIITIMRLYSDSYDNFFYREKSVVDFAQEFGALLQEVALMVPKEVAAENIREKYSNFVTPEMLKRWTDNPEVAPGRASSSPWPDRFEVSGLEKLSREEVVVRGTIVWITSTEIASGEAAFTQFMVLNVYKRETGWQIGEVNIANEIK